MPQPSLHHLALGQLDAGLRRRAHEIFLKAAAQLEGAAEQVVAGHQRRRRAIARERRRLAAPQHPAVDDVVVQKRGGMDQFDRDRCVDRVERGGVGAAAGAMDQQHEGRTQPLARAVDQVVADFRDQGLVGIEQRAELSFGVV